MKIRSVRILDTILCSGSLVWLFSPAWDAVKLTLPGGWLHLSLSFRGHRPYRFRSYDSNCSELAPGLMFDDFLPIPDAESLPFYPLVLKLVVSVRQNLQRKCSRTSKRCLSTFLFAVFGIQIDIAWFTWFCGHVSCFDLFST